MVSHDNYESFVIAHARAALRNALRATLSRRVRPERLHWHLHHLPAVVRWWRRQGTPRGYALMGGAGARIQSFPPPMGCFLLTGLHRPAYLQDV